MSSEKPFWEGKTCKEMAGLHTWLKEHDRQTAEKAWEEGYIQAVKNMNPMPGEESPEYTPNPYRKENA